MEEKEIDQLDRDFNIVLKSDNLSSLHELLEVYLETKIPNEINVSDLEDERTIKLWKKLMMKIENGDYNHFWKLITSTHSSLIILMRFSSKIYDIRELIEKREKFGLSSYEICSLIKGTHDQEYIKECIKDREKYGIDLNLIKGLIKETKDSYYIKECIEQREKFGIEKYEVKELLKCIKDVECIKSCIEDRKKLELDEENITYLIEETHDQKYIKECIKNRENLELNPYHVRDLIKATHDPEYIKECIKNREKFKLGSYYLTELIEETKDTKYIKECVENSENLGLFSHDIYELIKIIQDVGYIKECIENRERFGLKPYDIVSLIIATKDIDYIKGFVKIREKLKLEPYCVVRLVEATQDSKYIEDCIENKARFNFSSSDIESLIIATKDIEYIKKCVKNKEILELLTDPTKLILLSGDINYNIAEYEKKVYLRRESIEKLKIFTSKEKIKLPSEIKIGIEIETEGITDNSNKIEKKLEKTDWKVKEDFSLRNGTEVVSPILTGNLEQASNEIKSICAILNGMSQSVSKRCGGHIHIGADYLTNKQDWINLIEIWSNAEKMLYIISNKKGEIPREDITEYAQPISKKIEEAIKNGTINLEGEEDLKEFVNTIVKIQGARYSGINFCNLWSRGKNTIEYRLPNGTINPNTWIENINLFGGIIKISHELSEIQVKNEGQRSDKEKKLLENFKTLQTEYDEKKIAMALIELCICPEDRQIYIDRYNINSLLLEKSEDIKDEIMENVSKSKIGKKALTGKNSITGEEYKFSEAIIKQSLIEYNNDKSKN